MEKQFLFFVSTALDITTEEISAIASKSLKMYCPKSEVKVEHSTKKENDGINTFDVTFIFNDWLETGAVQAAFHMGREIQELEGKH
jgi:hypothetical protein